jgi:hypothetical protein
MAARVPNRTEEKIRSSTRKNFIHPISGEKIGLRTRESVRLLINSVHSKVELE